jgi:hypothetical protein
MLPPTERYREGRGSPWENKNGSTLFPKSQKYEWADWNLSVAQKCRANVGGS